MLTAVRMKSNRMFMAKANPIASSGMPSCLNRTAKQTTAPPATGGEDTPRRKQVNIVIKTQFGVMATS